MTDKTPTTISPWASWPLDREVVIARVVNADRETTFQAWTDPAQIAQWFGPEGFRIKTHQADIRPGGIWQFDMIAPNGTVFSSRMEFHKVEPSSLIEVTHGLDVEHDPDRFHMLVTFDDQNNGKTLVTLRQMHPSPQRRATVIAFGAAEYGSQTLGKLADHVAKMCNGNG
jgi:uncharacterized protein YndB with AHSA1/START domain